MGQIATSAGSDRVSRIILISIATVILGTACRAAEGGKRSLEHLTLQRKSFYQYPTAGYYAAFERGFYRDAGLDLTIVGGELDNTYEQTFNGYINHGRREPIAETNHQLGMIDSGYSLKKFVPEPGKAASNAAEATFTIVSWLLGIALAGGASLFFFNHRLHKMVEQRTKELRHREIEHRSLFENALHAILILGENGNYLDSNPAALKMLGYRREELLSMHYRQLMLVDEGNPDVFDQMWTKFLENGHMVGETTLLTKSGEHVVVVFNATANYLPGRHLTFLYDVTQQRRNEAAQRRLEKQLRQSQRLETIGTLAGGIAHDFNNLLTPIIGYADLGMLKSADDPALQRPFSQIKQAADRARQLINQILTFSHSPERAHVPVDLQQLVVEVLRFLRPSLPTTVEIRTRLDTEHVQIMADASQIHQVLMNLCTNAFQAMQNGQGVLTIELARVSHADLPYVQQATLSQPGYARLTISDTGQGISDEALQRIFEPFFTTKALGKGTGLGLWVVHNVVKQHGGHIFVESEVGQGAKFTLYLPLIDLPEAVDQTVPAYANGQGGGERILVVEDEPLVMQLLVEWLNNAGYEVEAEYSSAAALERADRADRPFDLVITDLTMPYLTGLQLSKKLTEKWPDLPVIMTTGFGENLDDTTLAQHGVCHLLMKPIELTKLHRQMRQLLQASSERIRS